MFQAAFVATLASVNAGSVILNAGLTAAPAAYINAAPAVAPVPVASTYVCIIQYWISR